MEDIETLLEDSGSQIRVIESLHDAALEDDAARKKLKGRVKNVLENQRSILDYLAVEITNSYGTPKGLIYYPLAQSESAFPGEMDSKMPGVASAEPKIRDAILDHQPFWPSGEWLRELNQLTREQKHSGLSQQLVREVYTCRVTEKATGATIQWSGLKFEPGQMVSKSSLIQMSQKEDTKPKRKPMELGKGPTGVLIFGVPLDLATQEPWPAPHLEVESGPLHELCFFKSHRPVLHAINDFQAQITHAVRDIAQAARL